MDLKLVLFGALLFICGIALCVTAFQTPGVQFAESIGGGFLIGSGFMFAKEGLN